MRIVGTRHSLQNSRDARWLSDLGDRWIGVQFGVDFTQNSGG